MISLDSPKDLTLRWRRFSSDAQQRLHLGPLVSMQFSGLRFLLSPWGFLEAASGIPNPKTSSSHCVGIVDFHFKHNDKLPTHPRGSPLFAGA